MAACLMTTTAKSCGASLRRLPSHGPLRPWRPPPPEFDKQTTLPRGEAGMEAVSPTIINLIIFVLAIYVGYHVVWTVTPALHTPLMAVTNAISAIVIVGAMLAAALTETFLGKTMGVLAVALAAVNIFGGFLVTRRMLEMFKKKEKEAQAVPKPRREPQHEHEPRHAAVPRRQRLLHPGAQGPVASHHLDPRQPVRHGRHGHRRAHHRRADRQDRRGQHRRHGLGAAGPGGRRRLRRLARQDGRDDQDARAGGLLPQHDRPGGGVHRRGRGGRACSACCIGLEKGDAHSRPATGWSCSWARPSARSPSRAR